MSSYSGLGSSVSSHNIFRSGNLHESLHPLPQNSSFPPTSMPQLKVRSITYLVVYGCSRVGVQPPIHLFFFFLLLVLVTGTGYSVASFPLWIDLFGGAVKTILVYWLHSSIPFILGFFWICCLGLIRRRFIGTHLFDSTPMATSRRMSVAAVTKVAAAVWFGVDVGSCVGVDVDVVILALFVGFTLFSPFYVDWAEW